MPKFGARRIVEDTFLKSVYGKYLFLMSKRLLPSFEPVTWELQDILGVYVNIPVKIWLQICAIPSTGKSVAVANRFSIL